MIHYFGILIDNENAIDLLLNELIKLKEKKNNIFTTKRISSNEIIEKLYT